MREGHGKIPMVRNCLFISIAVHSNVYLIELVSQKYSRLSSEFVSIFIQQVNKAKIWRFLIFIFMTSSINHRHYSRSQG